MIVPAARARGTKPGLPRHKSPIVTARVPSSEHAEGRVTELPELPSYRSYRVTGATELPELPGEGQILHVDRELPWGQGVAVLVASGSHAAQPSR
jgi:hypothetical protein